MKILFTVSICSFALATALFAQSPAAASMANQAGPTPALSPAGQTPAVSPAMAASPAASVSSDLADKIHKRIDKKLKQKGIHFSVDEDGETISTGNTSHDDIPALAIPLVGIIFCTIFGAPVLIVAVILYFGFSKNRMMHKTVRMMVEKGQPVPAALLNPPPHVRKRSDMRRGVVLMMVGTGLMLFFAAVNDWEGGAWSLGVIPFLVGVGYLLVWKLEGKGDQLEPKGDNPPPVP